MLIPAKKSAIVKIFGSGSLVGENVGLKRRNH